MSSRAWNLASATTLTLSFTLTLAACSREVPASATPQAGAAAAPAAPKGESVAQPLTTTVYNPGEKGVFAVTSVLVGGTKDALLIDAQFSTVDAQRLVELIRVPANA